ncbi:MAG: MBL fold metallo-hydrolase [Eubacteriales bacterium]
MLTVTTLASGSTGNCIHIKGGDTEILVDCGISCRALAIALKDIGTCPENIKAVFVTHEHIDHVRGLEVLCKTTSTPVVMNMPTARSLVSDTESNLSRRLKILNTGKEVSLGEISLRSFATPHDSAGSVGYVVEHKSGLRAGIATDIGHISKEITAALEGCRLVVLESNHDIDMLLNGAYPPHLKARVKSRNGHLSNDDCAAFLPVLADKGMREVILFHLSQDNNIPSLALETASRAVACAGLSCNVRVAGVKGEYVPVTVR